MVEDFLKMGFVVLMGAGTCSRMASNKSPF